MRKLLLWFCSSALAMPAAAQEAQPANLDRPLDPPTTILVNGIVEPLDQTGQAITTFGRAEMDRVQGTDLIRLLERAPGVVASRNGGPGAFTSLRVRGAEGDQLLVLLDGVRVADTASPGGGFDLGNLTMANLASVELQRSANSTIWGSQALGGVLAVTTGTGGRQLAASLEYGAYETLHAAAGGELAVGPLTVGLQAAHINGDGYSAAAAGTEPDGFRQTELAGQAELDLSHGLTLFARGRRADARLEIDGFPAPSYMLADTDEYQDTAQWSGIAGVAYTGELIDLMLSASGADTDRANFASLLDPAPSFTSTGTSRRAELRGQWRFAPDLALAFGGDREWLRFATLFDTERRTATTGFYAQLDYDGGWLHLAAGLRRDEHDVFGGAWSAGADAAFDLSPHWRLTASYGEGYKAPTLFQLSSEYGNAALQPERSRGYDLGLGWRDGPASVKLTAFRRDTRDLIGFDSCFGVATGICAERPFGTYDNIGAARSQGIELEAAVQPLPLLSLTAAYSYLKAEDRTPGSASRDLDLARRPHHALTLTGDWQAGALLLGADLRVVSDSFDDPANTVPLEGYAIVTLRGEWQVSQEVALFARIDNLTDDRYQTAAGYGTAGRSAYLGARARL